jgi:hypothetical protein
VKLSELAATKWTGRDIKIATAVALAESRGKLDETHENSDGSTDYGPWQVNSVHGFDPARLTSDPAYTVDAAHQVWSKQGWKAWTAYKTGAYLAFMGQDAELNADDKSLLDRLKPLALGPLGAAGAAALGADVPNPIDAVTGGVSVIGDVIGALTEPSTWLRIGKGYLGSILIIAGVGGMVFVVANRVGSTPAVKAVNKLPV